MNRLAILAACATLGGCGLSVEKSAQSYQAGRANALSAEYLQAQRNGDMIGMCVKSNVVSAAYRDAGDTANAEAWMAKNAADCQAARDMLMPLEGRAD